MQHIDPGRAAISPRRPLVAGSFTTLTYRFQSSLQALVTTLAIATEAGSARRKQDPSSAMRRDPEQLVIDGPVVAGEASLEELVAVIRRHHHDRFPPAIARSEPVEEPVVSCLTVPASCSSGMAIPSS